MSQKNWKIAALVLGIFTFASVSYVIYTFAFNRNKLNIKVGIESGGVLVTDKSSKSAPVRNVTFYLSKKDFIAAMEQANIRSAVPQTREWAIIAKLDEQGGTNGSSRFVKALEPHLVDTATTDSNGNATFRFSEAGKYYVIGIAQTTFGVAVWNLPVNTNQTQEISLNQLNAADIE
jgi:hypothetical protein